MPSNGRRGRLRTGTLLALVLVATLAGLGLWSRFARPGPAAVSIDELLLADDRIAPLFEPCSFTRPFAEDTSDMVAVLADQLAFGQLEPMRRAKQELAVMGASAVPYLERVFDSAYSDAWRHGVLENVLGVCTLMDGPWGLPLARRGLEHPKETVRLAALHTFGRHGGPEDYVSVERWIPFASSTETRAELVDALAELDPPRLARDLLVWLEEERWTDVHAVAARHAPSAAEPEVGLELARHAPGQPDVVALFLEAAGARHGDETALASLERRLQDESPRVRRLALEALIVAGDTEAPGRAMRTDPREDVRAAAASAIAELEPSPHTHALLTEGLSDPGDDVRAVCLATLAERGDETALAEALDMLGGGRVERQRALGALQGAWDQDPALAERAFQVLARDLASSDATDPSERVALLQAIAQVPGRRSAELLMSLGDSIQGEIRGWRAHRWCAFQTFNTGPEGRALLRELYAVETDPLRRVDLLTAIWQDRSDAARELVRATLLDPRAHPYEKVHAADVLAQLGPATEQAPFLKRSVYHEAEDPKVREALRCLLWRWYG